MSRVTISWHGSIIIRIVGAVGVVAVMREGPAHGVARRDVVVHFAGHVVEQFVIALVEAVAAGVAAVAFIRVVDLVAARYLRQNGLHARIDPSKIPEGEQVHLSSDTAGRVSE